MGGESGFAMFSSAGENSRVIGNFLLVDNTSSIVNQLNFHEIWNIHTQATLEPELSGHPEFIFVGNRPDLTEVCFRVGDRFFYVFLSHHIPGGRAAG